MKPLNKVVSQAIHILRTCVEARAHVEKGRGATHAHNMRTACEIMIRDTLRAEISFVRRYPLLEVIIILID